MKYRFLPHFTDLLADASLVLQKKFWKQLRFLLTDIQHPSLRTKKYHETDDIWQARIDRSYRFYFKIEGDTYVLTDFIKHKD